MTFKKLLCATDFSDSSREALRAAAELARTSQATLVLVHVWQAPLGTTDYGIELPNDPARIASALPLTSVCCYLGHTADHIKSLAGEIIYMVSAEHIHHAAA